jgi:hypothetical protein
MPPGAWMSLAWPQGLGTCLEDMPRCWGCSAGEGRGLRSQSKKLAFLQPHMDELMSFVELCFARPQYVQKGTVFIMYRHALTSHLPPSDYEAVMIWKSFIGGLSIVIMQAVLLCNYGLYHHSLLVL